MKDTFLKSEYLNGTELGIFEALFLFALLAVDKCQPLLWAISPFQPDAHLCSSYAIQTELSGSAVIFALVVWVRENSVLLL